MCPALLLVRTHKEIVGLWTHSPMLEELDQIPKLPMNIATDRHWCINMLHVRLLHKDFSSFETQVLHLRFGDGLASL